MLREFITNQNTLCGIYEPCLGWHLDQDPSPPLARYYVLGFRIHDNGLYIMFVLYYVILFFLHTFFAHHQSCPPARNFFWGVERRAHHHRTHSSALQTKTERRKTQVQKKKSPPPLSCLLATQQGHKSNHTHTSLSLSHFSLALSRYTTLCQLRTDSIDIYIYSYI